MELLWDTLCCLIFFLISYLEIAEAEDDSFSWTLLNCTTHSNVMITFFILYLDFRVLIILEKGLID